MGHNGKSKSNSNLTRKHYASGIMTRQLKNHTPMQLALVSPFPLSSPTKLAQYEEPTMGKS